MLPRLLRGFDEYVRIATFLWPLVVTALALIGGCKSGASYDSPKLHPPPIASHSYLTPQRSTPTGAPVQFASGTASTAPPRIRDIRSMKRTEMTLDEAVRVALQNSSIVRSSGGHVFSVPDSVRTPMDPAIIASDPNFGSQAALSAFDTQFESNLFWNGGGRTVGSGLSSGAFGVFSQPTTMATGGLSRTFATGTRVNGGIVGGYDSALASGIYAAYGGEVRHPLQRGAGVEFNRIAGPYASPGNYRGVWIARIDEQKSELELQQSVRDLVREVAVTYWELYFAHRYLDAKFAALQEARELWQQEQQRVAQQASPPDFEVLARQQFYTADANVQNAISGTSPGSTGVFAVETKLRSLLGLPASDGTLIWPSDHPLQADFRFDWNEAIQLAHTRRLELQKQYAEIQRRELELKATRNLQRPQVDLVAQYRSLADDPDDGNALFSEALQGWRVGLEVKRALGNRREKAAVQNAELSLRREHALLSEQQLQITAQLRNAFTELDRAYGVTQSLSLSRDAAKIRLQAEGKRHAEGDAHVERVLEAQTRATQAETSYLRSLVDYNLAFIQIHLVRGTLLDTVGVGFSAQASPDEIRYAQNAPSIFARSVEVSSEYRR